MHACTLENRSTAASLSPDRPWQGNYTLIILAWAWNSHPHAPTNTLTDSLTREHLLTQLSEIHSAVTQHLTLKVKQEGRFGTSVLSESYFPIADDLCMSNAYCIVSLSDRSSSTREVKFSPHTGRHFVTFSICKTAIICIMLIQYKNKSSVYLKADTYLGYY